jgi:hypothetical protein
VIATFVLPVAACAGSPPPRPPAPKRPAATLFYSDVKVAPGRTFPSPLVVGSVSGRPTTFVVDTGAEVSVVDATLAVVVGLPIGQPVGGEDPDATTLPLRRTDQPRLAIDGLGPIAERPTAVVTLPPVLARLGIGGILSPQALAEPGRDVVVDLVNLELRLADASAPSHASRTAQPQQELPPMNVCRFRESGFDAKVVVAAATIDGVEMAAEIDTGASGTLVVADSEAGRKLAARSDVVRGQAKDATGAFEVMRAGDVPVTIGAVPLRGAITVMPGKKDVHCGHEGRIGIDLLRSCILVIGESSARGLCIPET